VPTLAVSNVATPALQLTASLPTTPVSVQLVTVALVVPSYIFAAAATVAVTVAAVIVAVVVAVVDASVYFPASGPPSVSPFTVTVFPAPGVADVNVAVPVQVTTSPAINPVNAQLESVALVVPSYALFAAVTVAAVVADLIVAVVVAVRDDKV
jgi:hypothetical protein